MKKITTLLAGLALAFCFNVQATDINVDNSTIATAMSSAADGDVLLLAGGIYSSGINFQNGKVLTLKSAGTGTVTLTMQISPSGFAATNCGLIFDGLNIVRGGDYFIYGDVADVKIIKFINDTIYTVNRCLLRTANLDNNVAHTIDAIEIENTIIRDCGSNGYNLFYPKHIVKSFSVKNSTLYNYTNGESLFYPNASDTNNIFSFTFENNTVYKWGKDDTRALCNTKASYSVNSVYTFKNNIISEPGATLLPNIVVATGGTLTAEKNLVVNFGTYVMTDAISSTTDDNTLAGLSLSGIGFANVANGDFTIATGSPIATASTTGGIIGDPRWYKGPSTGLENNIINIENNKPVNVYSIDGRLIKQNVLRSEIINELGNGIYIIDHKKVVVNRVR